MSAFLSMVYGVVVYLLFFGTFLYAVGFVGNLVVPKSIDTGTPAPLAEALTVNLLLLGLFAMQHSVMARPAFKRWWTRIVPGPAERSTYVLFTSLALLLLFWQWRPVPRVVWSVQDPAGVWTINAVFWIGWMVMLASTFLINHFELFGLRQAFAPMTNRPLPEPVFRMPGLYRHVRHPLYLGFLIAFWAAPDMTAGHLLFSAATTGYVLVGIWFEERDLIAQFGDRYRAYREQVGMLLPMPRKKTRPRSFHEGGAR